MINILSFCVVVEYELKSIEIAFALLTNGDEYVNIAPPPPPELALI
jgi:hypothetical protein